MLYIISLIKKNWQAAITLLLLILIGYACAITRAYTNERTQRKEAENARNAAISLGNKSLFYANKKYHNDSLGWVTTSQALITDKNNIKALSETKEFGYLNQIKGLKKNKSNVISATTFDVQFDTVYLPYKPISLTGDTTIQKSNIFHWEEKDEWNDINIYSIGKPKFKSETEINQVINFGKRTKKFLFFRVGPREIISQVNPTNLNYKVTKVNTIVNQ